MTGKGLGSQVVETLGDFFLLGCFGGGEEGEVIGSDIMGTIDEVLKGSQVVNQFNVKCPQDDSFRGKEVMAELRVKDDLSIGSGELKEGMVGGVTQHTEEGSIVFGHVFLKTRQLVS